jgi:hypothetical protein
MLTIDPNGLYYTFSTIAQTLAGAFALLGAFVLYRLQSLNEEIKFNGGFIVGTWPGGIDGNVDAGHFNRNEQYAELIQLSERHSPHTNISGEQRERLKIVVAYKSRFLRLFHFGLFATAPLIVASIGFLPFIKSNGGNEWLAIPTFVCVVGVAACVSIYIRVILFALGPIRHPHPREREQRQ